MNSEDKDYISASAILHVSGTNLTERQQALLDKLPKAGSLINVKKEDVTMDDLAAMTAKEGVEFSMFTGESDCWIMRGKEKTIEVDADWATVLNDKGYVWNGHTHADMTTYPSNGDYEVLSYFNQDSSFIYNIVGNCESFYKP